MMKVKFLYLKILLLSINLVFSQSPPKNTEPFKAGEALEYRVHYGIFNASYASLKLSSEELNGEKLLLASGYGKTIGLARLFFKVEDYYSSYFDNENVSPVFFKRNIYEGGYTKNLEVQFDSESNEAIVNNIKNGTIKTISTEKNIQDLISSLYYLRKNFFSEQNWNR
jgi:hypothetical protein